MADLAPTAISLGGQATRRIEVQFGEAVAATDWLYRKISDGKYYKADADASQAAALVKGIALVGGALDAFGIMVTSGLIIFTGVTMSIGDSYYLSVNAGKMRPQTDIGTVDWLSYLGQAATALNFDVRIKNYSVKVIA